MIFRNLLEGALEHGAALQTTGVFGHSIGDRDGGGPRSGMEREMANRLTKDVETVGGEVDVSTLPPLKPAWFHILLSLSEEPRHGFSIRESVEARTKGAVKLWPATLYGAMKEMTSLQLIEPLEGEDDPDSDQRRRYHRLTARGMDLLRIEADRLQSLVDAVRAVGS